MPATPKPPLIDIRPDHWAIVRDILQKHVPQYEVWAFGSRAKWTAKEYSDLDLAVITDKPLSLSVSAALTDDFSESDLPWKVDVVDWATTSESFRKIIERDKVVVQVVKAGRGMAGEWHTLRLGNVCRKIGSGATPRGGRNVYLDRGDVALIRSQNIYNDGLHRDGLVYLTAQHAAELANVQVEENDVLLNITGDSVARSCQVAPDVLPARVNQHVAIIRPDPNVLSPRFLRYYFVSPSMQAEMLGLAAVGATRNALTKGMIESFEISAPVDIEEQRAIAHILGTLDDKIELNRRMNETLEAIARGIFKSWFVDFDPVRAKASGEPPESICRRLGLTPDLLARFPDRLVDSELGEIPEGWGVASLEQLTCYLNRGLSPKYVEDGGALVLNQKCVRGGHVDISKGRRHDPTQRKVEGRHLEIGDILVNSTGVGTLGRVAQVLAIDEPTIVDSHITVVRSAPEKVSWNYLGITLLERQSEIEALGEGSTGQTELSRVRLGALRVLLPPEPLRDHFDACVTGLRQRGMANNAQSVTLAQIRDALLPKLLSGELRVPVAEIEAEATA